MRHRGVRRPDLRRAARVHFRLRSPDGCYRWLVDRGRVGLLGALSQVFVFLTMRQLKGLNVFVIVHYFALASVILTLLWLALIQQVRRG